jgi:probable HAF family extracellular repeat protein
MRRSGMKFPVVAVGALVTVMSATGRAGRLWTFAAIDAPNASFTTAQGINARGDIVGWFVDSKDKGTHGYLLRDGAFKKIDYPGAIYTDARGINARGDIVGAYRMTGEPSVNFHGYLRTKHGEFVPLDFPGHTNTIAQRITSTGLVLGCRHDADLMDTMRGVLINGRDPTETAEIDAFASMNNGATPDGSLIVGLFTDMDTKKGHGYLLYGDTFIPFDAPGSTLTSAWDVNADGAVVGAYRDAANKFHGFLWEDLRFTAIDYPTASATRAFGINSRGDIVGGYVDVDNVGHGFVAAAVGRGDDH